ncbi:hypothetical protein HQ590_15750, partial [bacterium]|nr:hypothetical protein [bacterium]
MFHDAVLSAIGTCRNKARAGTAAVKVVAQKGEPMADDIVKLNGLKKDEVPADFRAETYFDFRAHPFAHQALFEQTTSVYGAILVIHDYAVNWLTATIASKRAAARTPPADATPPTYTAGQFEVLLEEDAVFAPARIFGRRQAGESYAIYLERGARVVGADIYLDQGSIYIGAGTTVEPGVAIKGPTIVGQRTEIRQGAYLRGDCILGDDGVIRGEIKNAVLMDQASFPHPSYVGDSACGYRTHFGNQVTAANLGLYEGVRDSDKRQ